MVIYRITSLRVNINGTRSMKMIGGEFKTKKGALDRAQKEFSSRKYAAIVVTEKDGNTFTTIAKWA